MSRALRASTSELQLGVLYRSASSVCPRLCKNCPSQFVSSGSRGARCKYSAGSSTRLCVDEVLELSEYDAIHVFETLELQSLATVEYFTRENAMSPCCGGISARETVGQGQPMCSQGL